MPRTKFRNNTIEISIRCPKDEADAIHKAATLLRTTISSVIEYATLDLVHKLGIYELEHPPKKPKRPWALLPNRDDGPSDARITLSVSHFSAHLFKRAAEYVSIPDHEVATGTFAVGATLHFLARMKNAPDADPKLAKLVLPEEYENRK